MISSLQQCLNLRMAEGYNQADSKSHSHLQIGVFLTSAAASFISNPILSAPVKDQTLNPIYSALLSYGSFIGFSFLTSWAGLELAGKVIDPLGKKEWEVIDLKKKILPRGLLVATCLAIGVFAKLGMAYLNYSLNNKALFLPITNITVDAFLPAYSAAAVISVLVSKSLEYFKSPIEKDIITARDRLIDIIKTNVENLPKLTELGRNAFAERIIAAKQPEGGDFIDLATTPIDEVPPKSSLRKWSDISLYSVGACLAASLCFGIGYVGHQGFQAYGFNNTQAIVAGVATAGIFSYVLGELIPHHTAYLIKSASVLGYEPSLTDRLNPKMSRISKTIALTALIFSFGGGVSAAKYYFSGGWSTFFQCTWGAASIALVTKPLLEFTTMLTQRATVKRFGTENDKELVLYHQKMEQFSHVLKNSPLPKVARFLRELPDRTFSIISAKTNLSIESLENFTGESEVLVQ